MSFLLPLALVGAAAPALAQNAHPCGYQGRLVSLGTTADGTRSLWLSAITTSFREDVYALYGAVPPFPVGTTPVDTWSGAGLRLSVSNVVAPVGAGAHSLFANPQVQPCQIDQAVIAQRPDAALPPGGGGGGSGGGGGGGANVDVLRPILRGAQQSLLTLGLNRGYSISQRVVDGLMARTGPAARGPAAASGPHRSDVWLEGRYTDLKDDRYGIDADGRLSQLLLGVDHLVRDDLAIGVALAGEDGRLNAYGGFTGLSGSGIVTGPYVGWRAAPQWILDAWVAYGVSNPDYTLGPLRGSGDASRWFVSANATGLYAAGSVALMPKLSVFYGQSRADAFAYSGTLAGGNVQLDMPSDSFYYGTTELSLEASRAYASAAFRSVVPYVRAGVRYDFKRPNDGELLSSSLTLETPGAWSGSLRAGVRLQPGDRTFIDGSAGYLSFGQSGLDMWDARLSVSRLF